MDPWVVSHVLRKNIATLGVDARRPRCTGQGGGVGAALGRAKAVGGAFDFVSFCPPYYRVSYPDLLLQLDASPLIAEHTLILVESRNAEAGDQGGHREPAAAHPRPALRAHVRRAVRVRRAGPARRGRRVGGAAGGGDAVREGGRGEEG